MKTAIVQSSCECEARLYAELDEHHVILRGWAKVSSRDHEENAPSNAMRTSESRFDIGWMCPVCTRNVLRSFDQGSLVFRERRQLASV
jgi:hypothetical protein